MEIDSSDQRPVMRRLEGNRTSANVGLQGVSSVARSILNVTRIDRSVLFALCGV